MGKEFETQKDIFCLIYMPCRKSHSIEELLIDGKSSLQLWPSISRPKVFRHIIYTR